MIPGWPWADWTPRLRRWQAAKTRPAPRRHLYHVLFEQPPIWNEGKAGDTVMVEILEHWLEEA